MPPESRKGESMAVEPNSTIRLLSEVPLSINSENTIYFASKAEQSSYFIGKTVASFNDNSYQRVSLGTMRIACLSDTIQNCNYLMFINRNHGAKWFYAFVTDVRYINDSTTEVDYVLDDLQSYFFDIELKACYVEREHSSTDVAGDNVIPEEIEVPLDEQDYPHKTTNLFNRYTLGVICQWECNEETLNWRYNKTWNLANRITNSAVGLNSFYYKKVMSQEVEEDPHVMLDNAMDNFAADMYLMYENTYGGTATNDDTSCVFPISATFVTTEGKNTQGSLYGALPKGQKYVDYTVITQKPTKLGDYTPRNKKLLTQQFNKLICNTYDEQHEYYYEYFKNPKIEFRIFANLCPPTSYKAVPLEYKHNGVNYEEGVLMNGPSSIPWSVDKFQDWVNRNGARLGVQGLTSLIPAYAGVNSGLGDILAGSQMLTEKTKVLSAKGARKMSHGYEQVATNFSSVFGGIASSLAMIAMMKRTGQDFKGTTTGDIEVASDSKDFFFYQRYPRIEYCNIVDEFFDMFGYATKRVKIPNIHVRKKWTYTKTLNAIVTGGAPASSLQNIENLFNSGLRFWNNGDSVGDYSGDNSPLS